MATGYIFLHWRLSESEPWLEYAKHAIGVITDMVLVGMLCAGPTYENERMSKRAGPRWGPVLSVEFLPAVSVSCRALVTLTLRLNFGLIPNLSLCQT